MPQYMCGSQRTTRWSWLSLPPLCGFLGRNSGYQACTTSPLTCWPILLALVKVKGPELKYRKMLLLSSKCIVWTNNSMALLHNSVHRVGSTYEPGECTYIFTNWNWMDVCVVYMFMCVVTYSCVKTRGWCQVFSSTTLHLNFLRLSLTEPEVRQLSQQASGSSFFHFLNTEITGAHCPNFLPRF